MIDQLIIENKCLKYFLAFQISENFKSEVLSLIYLTFEKGSFLYKFIPTNFIRNLFVVTYWFSIFFFLSLNELS